MVFVALDEQRRTRVMQAVRTAQAASHPADWTQRSDLSAMTIEGRPGEKDPRLLRTEPATLMGWAVYDRTQNYTVTATENLILAKDEMKPVSAALLVPPWPNPKGDDIRNFELAAAQIMQVSRSHLLSCSIAVDGALGYLNGVAPAVDALHAWSRLAENPNLAAARTPMEAGQQRWGDALLDIDAAWGQRLGSLVMRLKAVQVFAEITPVDLSPSESGNAPAFNLGYLMARLTDPHRQVRARGSQPGALRGFLGIGAP